MNTLPIISINGEFTDQLSVLDRGFAFGDGVFETCRLQHGKINLWNLHRDRLSLGCDRLKIAVDFNSLDLKIQSFLNQIDRDLLDNAILKVTVTRGQGGRGYAIASALQPTSVFALFAAPEFPIENFTQGINVKVCNQRLSCNASLAGLKHLNRLEQILARSEWTDPSIGEGLLLDTKENVIEATASNLFLVREGRLITPDLSFSGVAGVMRRFIIETLAPKLELKVGIAALSLNDLRNADEIFLCNSAFGIWPVRKIEAPVSMACPIGRVTQQLQQALNKSEMADV